VANKLNRRFGRAKATVGGGGGGAGSSLLFDGFENGLDGLNGAGVNPNWQFVDVVNASIGDVDITTATGGVTPISGTKMLRITTTDKQGGAPTPYPDYGADVDIQPWNAAGGNQGSKFAYEVTQGGAYTEGVYRALEFYFYPDQRSNTPVTAGGRATEHGCLQLGAYSMALSQKGNNDQELRGGHGYHTVTLPATNGRWMKFKMFRAGGMRTTWPTPCAYCTVSSTNGIAFQAYEPVTCSPSGVTIQVSHEATPWSVSGNNQLWGFWTAYNGIPSAGDTLTGTLSGASRTISAAVQYVPGNYGLNSLDPIGFFTGFDDRWMMQGGNNMEWHLDYPNATYWDRVTRFYVATLWQPSATEPVVEYMDDMRWVSATDDDCVAVSNMGGFYDPALQKLFISWEKNHDWFNGKTWQVYVSTSDMHVNGLGAGTLWQSIAGVDYACASVYETLADTFGDAPIYVAIKPSDRSTFAQIELATA